MNKNENLSFIGAFSVASVWFGAHVGGGFASGSQTMSFFIRYGKYAVLFSILSMVVVALTYRENMIMARHYGAYDYNSLGKALYKPYDKFMSPIYDICYISAGLLAVSASVAGAAELITQVVGVPYIISVFLIGALTLVLSVFGSDLVSRASSVMSIVIVTSFLIICLKGITVNSAVLAENLQAPMEEGMFLKGLIKALSYAGFQCFAFLGLLGATSLTKTDKDCTNVTAIGFVLNAGMLALTVLLIQSFMPQVAGETLPILAASKVMGGGFLTVLYSIALFSAFLSTAVAVVYGNTMRFTRLFKERGIGKQDGKLMPILVGLVIIAISMAVASVGLTKIIAVGYSYFGYIGIFLVIIPSLTYCRMRNKKHAKEKLENN
jgi:uncharacterized membrane protein YkvI